MLKPWFLKAFRRTDILLIYRVALLLLFPLNGFTQLSIHYDVDGLEGLTRKAKKSVNDSLSLTNYLRDLQLEAWRSGYLTFTIDSVYRTDSLTAAGSNAVSYLVKGSVGPRFREVQLEIDNETGTLLRSLGLQSRSVSYTKADPAAVGRLLKELLQTLENNGYPFAKIELSTLALRESSIQTQLKIVTGPLVRWKTIHIVGEEIAVSEKFIARYLKVEPGSFFSQETINLIPLRLKQITYLKETKPAELLFTPGGAELFIYLESKPVSLFNGTVGLQQNPVTKTYQFTGDLRLKLLNTLKRGELFDLTWRSIQPGSPQLKVILSYPYLFNTPFGIDGQFQLFKRDSTFLEVKSTIGVNYFLSAGNTLKAFYRNHTSSLLGSTSSGGAFGTTKSNQYGLSLTHQAIDYLPNPRRGFIWTIEGSAGQRTVIKDTTSTSSLIFSGRAQADGYFPIGKRNVIRAGGLFETFSTENIQQNELIRFGGNGSQRGFLEDELLASTRFTATTEYRFILDRNSYLFAFFDQSWYERNLLSYLHDAPYGFGTGLCFGTNLGIFSLTYALGSQQGNPILFRDSKIHFGYVAYF